MRFQAFLLFLLPLAAQAQLQVGASAVDISPTEFPAPVNGSLSARFTEAVSDPMHARSLVLESRGKSIALCICDLCMISDEVVEEARSLAAKATGIAPEGILIAATHTHSAATVCPVFGSDPDPAFVKALPARIAAGIIAAYEDRELAELGWASADEPRHVFNRRWLLKEGVSYENAFGATGDRARMNPGHENPDLDRQAGPVDPEVFLLAARRKSDRSPIAALGNYSLHYVGGVTPISADYFGMFAREMAERLEAGDGTGNGGGFVGILSNGTSADVNNVDFSKPRFSSRKPFQRAGEVAEDVAKAAMKAYGEIHWQNDLELDYRLWTTPLGVRKPDAEEVKAARARLQEIGERALKGWAETYLRETDKLESYPDSFEVPLQALRIGDLGISAIPCEVFTATGLALKKRTPFEATFTIELANGYHGYLPTPRQHELGGYETWRARSSYLEEKASEVVLKQLLGRQHELSGIPDPTAAKAPENHDLPPPLSPEDSLACIQVPTGYRVELVAAEPLVLDPVAIDWASDGRLFVAEMLDYPLGMDDKGKPGGRIRVLHDRDGDGSYDEATIFAEGLAYPMGVKVWRDGVLITAAPDILFARDTDGDGKADSIEPVVTGFAEGNQQLRVNGLRYGIDGWLHGANGKSDGKIRSVSGGDPINLSGNDFRIRPDTWEVDLDGAGESQFGRAHDDLGNWFGVDNSNLGWHVLLEPRYLRGRSLPNVQPLRQLVAPRNPPVFPASILRKRLHADFMANRFTSACGIEIYRDNWLFPRDGRLHLFTCEPVHNCVTRRVLEREGISFRARRAVGEEEREFFASTDLLSRPVMARTGPDGALWIVDMYRDQVEHPQWIPDAATEHWKSTAGLRAGHEYGRIYRVVLAHEARPAVRPLGKNLYKELQSSNGPIRELAAQELRDENDPIVLRELARTAPDPRTRLQALGLLGVGEEEVLFAMRDPHPAVRRYGLRLMEGVRTPSCVEDSRALVGDPDPAVRMQLALSMAAAGFADDGASLSRILRSAAAEDLETVRSAVLVGLGENPSPLFFENSEGIDPEFLLEVASPGSAFATGLVRKALPTETEEPNLDCFRLVRAWLRALKREKAPFAEVSKGTLGEDAQGLMEEVQRLPFARMAADPKTPAEARGAAIDLSVSLRQEVELLPILLASGTAPGVRLSAARGGAGRWTSEEHRALILERWGDFTPAVKGVLLDAWGRAKGGTGFVLGLLEEEMIPARDLDLGRRRRLLLSKAEGVAARAKAIFAKASAHRAEVLQDYQKALVLKGDRTRGKEVFARVCVACHRLEGAGVALGPDLRSVTDRSPGGLLSSILDPSRIVDPVYQTYSCETNDGRLLLGMIAGESGAGMTLVTMDGQRHEVRSSEIKKMEPLGASLMPDGLEAQMDKQAVADLISYLGY